jgi:hypothetical protein
MPPVKLPGTSASVSRTLQQAWITNLTASLKQAGLPDATVNQVTQQQSQQQNHILSIWCFVAEIATWPDRVQVLVRDATNASSETSFNFPPNDPKLLSELMRAQNNPTTLQVGVTFDDTDPEQIKLLSVQVAYDSAANTIYGEN